MLILARRLILKGLLGLVTILVLIAPAGLIYRAWSQRQSDKALVISDPAGIDEAMFVETGGAPQWITIRGRNRANPVVLMLHGGPGASNGPYSLDFLPFEADFTIVQWDQPGAAKSFARAGGKMEPGLTIDGVAQYGILVAEFLQTHLHTDKTILLGWSWGSIVGIEMVRRRPDLFAAYVGTGQVVNIQEGEAIVYARVLAAARSRGNQQAVRELEAIGPPPYEEQAEMGTQRKWAFTFAGEGNPITQFARFAFLGPRYSLGDAWSYMSGFLTSQNHFIGLHMEGEMMRVNLAAGSKVFALPVFVIQGTRDDITPPELSRAFVETLTAPQKAFIPIEGAGHLALVRNQNEFLKVMKEQVGPIAAARSSEPR